MVVVIIIELFSIHLYYKDYRIKRFFEEKFWYLFDYSWDFCVLIATPFSILLMLVFEINDRIQMPYGDFINRTQEFIFGWLVLLVILVAAITLSSIKGKKSFAQKQIKQK